MTGLAIFGPVALAGSPLVLEGNGVDAARGAAFDSVGGGAGLGDLVGAAFGLQIFGVTHLIFPEMGYRYPVGGF